MGSNYYKSITVCITLCFFSNKVWAANFGNVENSSINDSAAVCLSLGVWANITGLEDFELQNQGTDGDAGTRYEGMEDFFLESNSPVRVMVEGGMLSNGEDSIYTNYAIDGTNTV